LDDDDDDDDCYLGWENTNADYYFILLRLPSALSEPLLCPVTLRVPSKDPLAEDTVFTANSYQSIQ